MRKTFSNTRFTVRRTRRGLLTALACPLLMGALAGAAFGQAPAPALTFDVASIKPAAPITPQMVQNGQLHVGVKFNAARVEIANFSLADLVRTAYDIKPYQLTGLDNYQGQRFDVQAKLPEGATKEQMPMMLRALLEERFKLKIHHDSKEQSVYGLVVAKGGPKMKEAPKDDAAAAADSTTDDQLKMEMNKDGKGATVSTSKTGPMHQSMGADGSIHLQFDAIRMPVLAEQLSAMVDRPVVDMTDLKGKYSLEISFTMDDIKAMMAKAGVAMPAGGMGGGPGGGAAGGGEAGRQVPGAAAAELGGGTIFSTLQQFGLKLEPRKAPMDLIVVDHAEKMPIDN